MSDIEETGAIIGARVEALALTLAGNTREQLENRVRPAREAMRTRLRGKWGGAIDAADRAADGFWDAVIDEAVRIGEACAN
jgi:hypothetical protein